MAKRKSQQSQPYDAFAIDSGELDMIRAMEALEDEVPDLSDKFDDQNNINFNNFQRMMIEMSFKPQDHKKLDMLLKTLNFFASPRLDKKVNDNPGISVTFSDSTDELEG